MKFLDESALQKRSAGYLANHMARLFARALAEAIAPLGLAPAQFMVLLELWKTDGLSQVELVRRLDVEQATMAKTLSRMVRDGLVTRAPHPRDARATLIHLTEHARGLRKPAKAAAKAVDAMALGDLSGKEQDRFFGLLHRVIAALRAERDKPAAKSEPAPLP